MIRNREPLHKLVLAGILLKVYLVGCASGIVVRLGDATASYNSPIPHEVQTTTVRFLPRLASLQPWKYSSAPLPFAFVVRQLPFLAQYPNTQTSTQRHPSLRPTPTAQYNLWRDQTPLPYYPLSTSPSSIHTHDIPRGQQLVAKLQHQQEVQVVQQQSEIPPLPSSVHKKVAKKEKNVAGEPGLDYPTYGDIPKTSFSCKDQRYKGFFGDPETRCQAWHYCDFNGGQASFLCPNGTIFSQVLFTCDWWFNVQCNSTLQQYVINERLYKYIIPMAPSFPEDFQGPEVNQYLTLKFMELIEKEQKKLKEKMKESEKNKSKENVDDIAEDLGDEEALNRHYLLQALSNDLETKEG